MLKKTIKYTDYNGEERTEDFYFNLTKAEITELEASEKGGLSKLIEKVINERDTPKILKIFKEIILMAYGEKSVDGKRFIKSKELSEAFSQTEAYTNLFMEMINDENYAAEFVNSIIPADIADTTQNRQ